MNREKNNRLKAERGISFEEIVLAIANGGLRKVIEHRRPERYPGQRIIVVVWKQYVFDVPFVQTGDELFLKTIIPNRKATRAHKKGIL